MIVRVVSISIRISEGASCISCRSILQVSQIMRDSKVIQFNLLIS